MYCGDNLKRLLGGEYALELQDSPGLFGVPILHAVPGVLATRKRIAQTEEVLAGPRRGPASTSSSFRAGL